MLSFLLDCGIKDLTKEKLRGLLTFANAGASLITTKTDALKGMPEKVEIEALINEGCCKS